MSGGALSLPLPIISSSPHFLDGDPSLRINVTGLSPSDDLHRSYMDVEPLTGSKDERKLKIPKENVLVISGDEWCTKNASEFKCHRRFGYWV